MKLAVLDQILAARRDKRAVILVTELAGGDQKIIDPFADHASDLAQQAREAAISDRSHVVEQDGRRYFLNVFNPPLRLIIVGAVHIAQPLAELGRLCGYQVAICDPRGAFATRERFPDIDLVTAWPDEAMIALAPDRRSAIVTLTHDPKLDDPALNVALRTEAFYIGALGSRRTHAKRLERLAKEGFGENELSRIHAPIGLNIGGVSQAEVAVSIVAEMTQVLRRGEV